MDPLSFCQWLQGFAELSGTGVPTSEQWRMIKEHLQTVFVKVTPPLVPITPLNPLDTLPTPDQPNFPSWPPGTIIC